MKLKVGTYNINFGQDNSVEGKPLNLENIANVILENDLDLITLNEVHVYAASRKSAGRHTPFEVSKLANAGAKDGDTYAWAFAPGMDGSSPFGTVYSEENPGPGGFSAEGVGPAWNEATQSGYGNAILTKYPIKSVREVRVMAPGQTKQLEKINGYTFESRALLIAELDVHGEALTVIATHFDLYTVAMKAAIAAIAEEMKSISSPILLMGDLNCSPEDAPIHMLQDLGFVLIGDETDTHDTGGRIDFIMYANATATDETYYVLSDNKVSDHRPVIAAMTMQA